MNIAGNFYYGVAIAHCDLASLGDMLQLAPEGRAGPEERIASGADWTLDCTRYTTKKRYRVASELTSSHDVLLMHHGLAGSVYEEGSKEPPRIIWLISRSASLLSAWNARLCASDNLNNGLPLFLAIDLEKVLDGLIGGINCDNCVKLATLHAKLSGDDVKSISLHSGHEDEEDVPQSRRHLLSLEKTKVFRKIQETKITISPLSCRFVYVEAVTNRLSIFADNNGSFGMHLGSQARNIDNLAKLLRYWVDSHTFSLSKKPPPLRDEPNEDGGGAE